MKNAKKELAKVRRGYRVVEELVQKLIKLVGEQERTCDVIAGELQRQAKLLDALRERLYGGS